MFAFRSWGGEPGNELDFWLRAPSRRSFPDQVVASRPVAVVYVIMALLTAFHLNVLVILACSISAQALQGPSCSVEVCGSPEQCSSGQTCTLCQGHTIVCTCFVDGIAFGWTNDQFDNQATGIAFISPMDSASESDSVTGAVAQVTDVGRNGMTIVNISSTLTLNVTSDLFDGTRIGCYDSTGVGSVQTVTLNLTNPPLPPAQPTVQFNNPGQSFTVSWNNVTSPFNGYTVTVSPTSPCTQPPDISCNTVYVCSGWSASTQPNMFEFSVNAVCGNVVGSRSAATTVNLQAPNPPTLTTTPLYDSSGSLLEIESQATEGSPVNITDGVDGSLTEYIFFYNGAATPVPTGSTGCTSSSCQHTFNDTSSQAQQYTVTVAASNVVGMGTASASMMIDPTNNIFNVTVDGSVGEVTFYFLSSPVTSVNCTIQYGTDPTYVNLPYTDSSTGSNVNSVTVLLTTPLRADVLYYYVVSCMGARMQGSFRTECSPEDLGNTVDTITDNICPPSSNGSVQINNGVACYNGIQTGSEATYFCNCGLSLQGVQRRVCLQSGLWSGTTTPVCQTNCSQIPQPPSSLVVNAQLATNSCAVLNYDCTTVTSGSPRRITLQYNCSTEQWSATDTCIGATNQTTTIVVVVVCVILAVLLGVDIGDLCYMKYKGVSTLALIILAITVIGIPFAIPIYCYTKKKAKKGHKEEGVELKEPSPDKTPPPVEGTDSAPAPILYADPSAISREEHPSGDVYTMPDKARKTHKPEDRLPTYQDPGAISHEAAPTGELYTVPDKKKGAKKKKQPQASRPSEEQLAEMYSQPDKTRKQQSQGLNYADVGFSAPSSGKVPDKPPQVFYSDVNVKNV